MAKPTTTLAPPHVQIDWDIPFKGDLFKRVELANQLTEYITRLRDGAVLAIDAPWGEGKSWFGRNWAASLKSQDYRIIYLDAFQQDYFDDPFLLIAAEINEVLDEDETRAQAFKEKAANVMKAMIPVGTKALLNVAGRLALGSADLSKELTEAIQSANDSTADATQKWLEEKIEAHAQEKASLENFREELKAFCLSQEKPVVFFIDELDRCRPTFAVRLIERIKHFFDVPNLVFVLLLNRSQLEKSIKGVYGSEIDASAYLGKFVHLFLKLPKNADITRTNSNANWDYIWALTEHYKIPHNQPLDQFAQSLTTFASLLQMSLRDLEKAMALLALNGLDNSSPYLSWLVVLKIKYPEIFVGLINNELEAHQAAIDVLEKIQPLETQNFWIQKYYLAFHHSQIVGLEHLSDQQKKDFDLYKPQGWYGQNPFRFWLKRLDIAIQDY